MIQSQLLTVNKLSKVRLDELKSMWILVYKCGFTQLGFIGKMTLWEPSADKTVTNCVEIANTNRACFTRFF